MDSTALPRRSFSWLRSSSSSALQRVLRGRVFSAGFPMMGMWFFSAKMEKRWEKMDSLKTYFVCVKPCTVFFPFMENGVLQKISQKLLATYQRCRPAVPTDACIRCNFDSDAPISRESLRRPQKARKFCQVWGGYYDLVADNSCVEATHVWFWFLPASDQNLLSSRNGWLVLGIPMDYDNPQYIW